MSNGPHQNTGDLAQQLHSIAIHLLRRLRKTDDGSGLNPARLSALSVVVFAGPITLSDLAAAEQVRPPTMTRIVAALQRQGLIVRHENPRDGRSAFLSATMAGKRLLLAARSRRIHSLASQIEGLADPERQTLEHAAGILARLLRPD